MPKEKTKNTNHCSDYFDGDANGFCENDLDENRYVSEKSYYLSEYPTEKCMFCGYEIMPCECKIQVTSTGDVLHRKCWQYYAEENFNELCCVINEPQGGLDDDDGDYFLWQ